MKIYLNRDWKFSGKDDNFEIVTLPHTVSITPFHYFSEKEYQMISTYQKEIDIPMEWKGKNVLLTFEGVAHSCVAYLNDSKIGEHHCGYTAFTLNLKESLIYGEKNVLKVVVDSHENLNIPPFGHVIDYMTYGGIYRDVYLDVKEDVYLEDVFVSSDLKDLTVKMKLNKEAFYDCKVSMRKKGESYYQSLGSFKTKEKNIEYLNLPKVDLWDIHTPNLYEIKVELYNERLIDEKVILFGFRISEFRKDGYYLNRKKVKIRGLNRHQSYPYVGYAMPASMQRKDADILKYELGCNAVRTSHYPQSHDFITRCDEIGLLVFTEIPGWQHIGDEEWKKQACENVKDMVIQYRNHPSIILWGVRINESNDDHNFYQETNEIAHLFDPTRPTGGVRNFKKSELLEDVYTYNDFVHDGTNVGCEPKEKVTSDCSKPYMVTEYNGHMYPTKSFDCEWHRRDHALRHASVLNSVSKYDDIVGSFGWCMADYNTHKDFGSGDRICYHGVLDMFRNPKMAASVYASQQENIPVLEISSGMEIGEYPASTLGTSYIFSNADSIKMYKNNKFIKEFTHKESSYSYMNHGPIPIDDLVGDLLMSEEGFTKEQSDATKFILNSVAKYGLNHIPMNAFMKMPKLLLKYKMTVEQVTSLYTKYIGNWGEDAIEYRFDAIKNGKVVKSITKAPMNQEVLDVQVSHTDMIENHTYDVSLIQIKMLSEYGNVLNYSNEVITLETQGPIEIIGPKAFALQGGMFGTYVKSTGLGEAKLVIQDTKGHSKTIEFTIRGE